MSPAGSLAGRRVADARRPNTIPKINRCVHTPDTDAIAELSLADLPDLGQYGGVGGPEGDAE